MMLLAMAAALAAAPQPGEVKTFKDWTVGCDNGRHCQAVALMPEDGDWETRLTMTVERGPEPNSVPEVRFEGEFEPHWLAAGGKRLPVTIVAHKDGGPAVRPEGVPALLEAIRAHGRLDALDGQGKKIGMLSLVGVSAALLYMDEQQRRIGTVTALVRKGAAPASSIPAPPPLPLIQRTPASLKAPRSLSKAQVRKLLGREETVCDYAQELTTEAVRLDARHSLVLATHPCGNGAYNIWSSAFIVDEKGRPRRAVFVDDKATDGLSGLVNAGWDAEERMLGTYMKGRGIGDCGVTRAFAWDGARFRLAEERVMGECRGSLDYIRVWRAEVR